MVRIRVADAPGAAPMSNGRAAYTAETILDICFRAAPIANLSSDFERELRVLRRSRIDWRGDVIVESEDRVRKRASFTGRGRPLGRRPLRRRRIERRRVRRLRERSIGHQLDVEALFANAAVEVKQRASDHED